MLQKSRSKTVAKFKYLFVLPLLSMMLTYVSCSEDREGINEKQSLSEQIDELNIKIQESENISEEESKMLMELAIKTYKDVQEKSKDLSSSSAEKSYSNATLDVPFAVVEDVPVFQGCEDLSSNEERKDCMSRQITRFVNMNFNTNLGEELNLKGVNRIITQFRIDETGKVVDVKARASHPELQAEAIRVISELPQMQPGKQDGKDISVMYSLPIVLQVGSSE
jgi:hypothetical protein